MLAHPGTLHAQGGSGRSTIGQRVVLNVTHDSVEMEYVAEIPAPDLYREARTDGGTDYIERRLAELAGGVALTWNGADLPTEAVVIADPARMGSDNFVELHVGKRAALPESTGAEPP